MLRPKIPNLGQFFGNIVFVEKYALRQSDKAGENYFILFIPFTISYNLKSTDKKYIYL